jgi:DNA sulfur modification protein DndB
MSAFEYTLPAIRGIQAGREYFITMCPLELVPRIFHFEESKLRPELRAQRILNTARIPEIARYITNHRKSYVLCSLTGSIDGEVKFESTASANLPGSLGMLRVPLSARLLIHDGLHRRAAIEEALRLKPDLGQETIPVVLYPDPGFRRAEQMFSDLKRNEMRSARSQSILYDHRDEIARVAKAVVMRVPVFADMTELVRSKISNRSLKLFTLSAIYHATATLLAGRQEESFSSKLSLATEFWSEVARRIPDWQQAKEQKISPAELRKQFVHAHAIGLAALGRVGQSLTREYPQSWRNKLKSLGTLNWSRSNSKLWEGRAMIAGRLSKATTCVVLTANALKKHLKIPLTTEEEQLEKRIK